MVNPQLAEYIKQQIQLGVPKEAIKSTLVTSGWPEADVNEALGPSSAQPAVSQPAAAPMAAASVSSPAISSAAQPALSAPPSHRPYGRLFAGHAVYFQAQERAGFRREANAERETGNEDRRQTFRIE